MISQVVEIVEVGTDYLVVKPGESGCQSCSSNSCGVTNFSQLFGKRSRVLKLSKQGDYEVGETAELLLDESLFVKSVMFQYLLPLLMMFLAVALAESLSNGVVIQVFAAISGLLAGIAVSRLMIRWYEFHVDSEHLKIRPLLTP